MSLPVVALVGRPNVGKSTLFNRLVGFKKSAVHDRPGVTRDRLYEKAEALGREFLCIDTGGIEPDHETELLAGMRRQVMVALEEADVIIFLVDGRAGYTPADTEIANLLRRTHKPIVVAVNKLDGPKHDDLTADFWQIGLEVVIPVSAEHGRGMYELMEALVERMPGEPPVEEVEEEEEEGPTLSPEELDPEDPNFKVIGLEDEIRSISIAVIGRPNIGKSTLLNQLLGEERHVVHDAPGTTMDPVDSELEIDGRKYLLVDTAGVRRKARIEDELERWVTLRSIEAIERCHLCLLMIDGTIGITEQDAKLAQLVADRGRALILVFNKWDLVKGLEDVDAATIEDQIREQMPHAVWAPHLFISAKTGKGVHRILPMVNKMFQNFNRHIGTAEVNRFLERVVATHTPPQRHHRPVRLYYGAQTRVRPPTFVFFSNTPDGVIPSYKAYLVNRLRQDYNFEGTPIRMHFRERRKLSD